MKFIEKNRSGRISSRAFSIRFHSRMSWGCVTLEGCVPYDSQAIKVSTYTIKWPMINLHIGFAYRSKNFSKIMSANCLENLPGILKSKLVMVSPQRVDPGPNTFDIKSNTHRLSDETKRKYHFLPFPSAIVFLYKTRPP